MISFTIDGKPRGKGRLRFTKSGNTYTPKETSEYEALVAMAYKSKSKGEYFDKGVPLRMAIAAYYGIPKKAGKRESGQMVSGEIRPRKKPDLDNVIKIIMDALNGVAYLDDAQVVSVQAHKFYSLHPRVEVTVGGLTDEQINKSIQKREGND